MFDHSVESEVRSAAADWNIEPAALLAVVEVESDGVALAEVDGRMLPPIRYEHHVFHRQIKPAARAAAVAAGLATPRWGQRANPRSQRERYALFERARGVDAEAAYAACSWGVGQVLGENARWLDFESAEALAAQCFTGVRGQVDVMLRFIRRRGLVHALAETDWTAFALGYNGPLHAQHDYAGRMARAYARHIARGPGTRLEAESQPILRTGLSGPAVRSLQVALVKLGAPLKVDGTFGPETRRAVLRAQVAAGLRPDGVVGPLTWSALMVARATLDGGLATPR